MQKSYIALVRRVLRKAVVCGLLLPLCACSMYHRKHDQTGSQIQGPDGFVIQVDDYGHYWDPRDAELALNTIQQASESSNLIVLLFVHGWHHNAKPDDGNVRDFAESVRSVRSMLAEDVYRQSRMALTGHEDVRIISVYVGWRGRSLPGKLDLLTFWGRKSAAENAGEGDLREFLIRLNEIYQQRDERYSTSANAPFMGLISFGHSFGGQVLFKSVASTLEQELIRAHASPSSLGVEEPKAAVRGFGTLTVLLNPALEAMQYDRINTLSRQLSYTESQTPILLVLSSEADGARRFWFPAGRALSRIFRPGFRGDQRALWTEALGEYPGHITHEADYTPNAAPDFNPESYRDAPCSITSLDLTHSPSISNVSLTPVGEPRHPLSPFLVARTSARLIPGHSDIFGSELREFMNDYVALAQGKKMLLSKAPIRALCIR